MKQLSPRAGLALGLAAGPALALTNAGTMVPVPGTTTFSGATPCAA